MKITKKQIKYAGKAQKYARGTIKNFGIREFSKNFVSGKKVGGTL